MIVRFLSVFLFVSLFFGTGISYGEDLHQLSEQHSPSAILKRAKKREQVALTELLSLLNVENDGTLAGIVAATQKAWLRQAGKERWQIEEVEVKNRHEVYILLEELGFMNAVMPTQKKYTYALVHGAAYPAAKGRIAFLVSLWNQGVRFDRIVFLTGARPLDPDFELAKMDLKGQKAPETETELMLFIYEQMNLPAEMRAIPLDIVDAPQKKGSDGKIIRPTTADTFATWLEKHPNPGSCLGISSQPFVKYQHLVSLRLLPTEYSIETVGPYSTDEIPISVYLDNVARWLYEENRKG